MKLTLRIVFLVFVFVLGSMVVFPSNSKAATNDFIRSTKGSGNLYEKLVVSVSNAVYVKEPTVAAKRLQAPAFSVFYRLKTDTPNNEKNGYYRIGKRSGEPIGWIKKNFVTKWNTRFGLKPSLPQTDRFFTLYQDENGETPYMKFTAGKEQVPDGARRFALITDVPDIDSSNEVYPVVVFTGSVESGGAREKEQMALYNLELEIVFVIDTTPSMEPLIEVAREVTRKTAESLVKMEAIKPVVHFGLVEYRDAPPFAEFAARTPCKLDEGHNAFWQSLKELKVSAGAEKNDIPEDMVAGLQEALTHVGWRPNSSKHIIILGDAPAKEGYDPVFEEDLPSSTEKTLADIMTEARPRGGSDAQNAVAAKNFHAVSNNHQSRIDQLLESDAFKNEDKDFKDGLKNLITNPEVVSIVKKDVGAALNYFSNNGYSATGAELIVTLIIRNDSMNRCQSRAQSQLRKLAANGEQLPGYYSAINTYESKNASAQAIKGLSDTLNKAYQALAAAREGTANTAGSTFTSGGSISKSIYQIISTKGDSKALNEVEAGYYATIRDENGRSVAQKQVMVFREELMKLFSQLDSLHTTFKNKSNKADRQNVTDILKELKEAVATQVAGQTLDEGTNLSNVIKFDFPLKTPALEISAKEIAVMTTPAFSNWLESLATARDRAKKLVLGGNTNWTTLNNEDREQFTFLALPELP